MWIITITVAIFSLIVGAVLHQFFLSWKHKKNIYEAASDFMNAVKSGQPERLFVFDAQEKVLGFNRPQHKLQALFAVSHNAQLVEFWLKTKRLTGVSFEEYDSGDPVHRAAVMISAGMEQKLQERDTRKAGGKKAPTRNRHPIEPDNVLFGLKDALGNRKEREQLTGALITRYTMMPPQVIDLAESQPPTNN